MKYTGERLVVDIDNSVCDKNSEIHKEHLSRYQFAVPYTKNKKVLDIACGSGYGTKLLSTVATEVIGGDINSETVAFAKQNYKANNLEFKILDATKLPFTDNYFDTIVSFETIEHLEDQDKYLAEIKRVLKSDGLFIVSTPDKNITKRLGIKNPFHIHELPKQEFINLLSDNFKNIKLFGQRPINKPGLKQKFLKKAYFLYTKIKWLEFLKSLLPAKTKQGIGKDISGLTENFSVAEADSSQDYLYYIIVCNK